MLIFNIDIINEGYFNYIPNVTQMNDIVITYNNCYGVLTDTHMSFVPNDNDNEFDMYIITGSLLRDNIKREMFLHSINYGLGTQFKPFSELNPMSVTEFLKSYNLVPALHVINGDYVIIAKNANDFDNIKNETLTMSLTKKQNNNTLIKQLNEIFTFKTNHQIFEYINDLLCDSNNIYDFIDKLNNDENCIIDDFNINGTTKMFELYSDNQKISLLFEVKKL